MSAMGVVAGLLRLIVHPGDRPPLHNNRHVDTSEEHPECAPRLLRLLCCMTA